jgi:hypothetical protein
MASDNDKLLATSRRRPSRNRQPVATDKQSSAPADPSTVARALQSIKASPVFNKFKTGTSKTNRLDNVSPTPSTAPLVQDRVSPEVSIQNSPTPTVASVARSDYEESEAGDGDKTILGPRFRQHQLERTDQYVLENAKGDLLRMPTSIHVPLISIRKDLTPTVLLQKWLQLDGINFRDQFSGFNELTSNSVARIRGKLSKDGRVVFAALLAHALYHATIENEALHDRHRELTEQAAAAHDRHLELTEQAAMAHEKATTAESATAQAQADLASTLARQGRLQDQLHNAATDSDQAMIALQNKIETEIVAPLQQQNSDLKARATRLISDRDAEVAEHNKTKDTYNRLRTEALQMRAWYDRMKPRLDAIDTKDLLDGYDNSGRKPDNPFHQPAKEPSILPRGRKHPDSLLDEFMHSPAQSPSKASTKQWESYTPPDSEQSVTLSPFLADIRRAFANLHVYNGSINREAPKPKRFSSTREEFQPWAQDCLLYLRANGKNYQYPESQANFIMQQTRSPARELVSDPFGIDATYSDPFDLVFRIWQVYGETDPFGAAEDRYSSFQYPRFPTMEVPDAVAAFASFQTQMQRFATQLRWDPQTHYYRIQSKLPAYIVRGTAVFQVTHTTSGIATFYQNLAAFVRNYMHSAQNAPADLPRRNINIRRNPTTTDTMFTATGQSTQAWRTPRFKPNNQPAPNATSEPAVEPTRNRCFNCGGHGHVYLDCPSPKKEGNAKDKPKPAPQAAPTAATAQNRHLYIPEPTTDQGYESTDELDSEYEDYNNYAESDHSESEN